MGCRVTHDYRSANMEENQIVQISGVFYILKDGILRRLNSEEKKRGINRVVVGGVNVYSLADPKYKVGGHDPSGHIEEEVTLLSYLIKNYDLDRIEEIIKFINSDLGKKLLMEKEFKLKYGKNILSYERSNMYWYDVVTFIINPNLPKPPAFDPKELVEPIIK